MKTKILISTIIRNRQDKLIQYFNQIERLIDLLKDEYEFSITIYENDSIDLSKIILSKKDYSKFAYSKVVCEDIGTEYYGSIVDTQRVINYANARNKTIENININEYDYMLIIEPDILYNPEEIKRIITREDLSRKDVDIYSGVVMMNNIPYDIWAMRRDKYEEWGGFYLDYLENPIKEFWSTANGICLYNMEPFKNGLKFSAFNERLNKYDCDTVVLCEDFRRLGYSNILINQSILSTHVR
jgi:hypothetical protein